jgi:hypothetical protein
LPEISRVLWACCVRLHPTLPASLSQPLPAAADVPLAERRHRRARAYRDGELICGRVDLTISLDARLGLAPRERRQLIARFVERLAPAFRHELEQLVCRRGAAAARIGDRIGPIKLVIEDPLQDGQRLVGHLEPPQWRRRELSKTEFVIRERS